MLQFLKSLASIVIIVLSTKVKQTLLRAAALYLLVSKSLLKAIAVLGPRRLNSEKLAKVFSITRAASFESN
jgi:hypothetical protein